MPSSDRKRTRSSSSPRVRVSVRPSGISERPCDCSSTSLTGTDTSLSSAVRSTSSVFVCRTLMPVNCRPAAVVTSSEW